MKREDAGRRILFVGVLGVLLAGLMAIPFVVPAQAAVSHIDTAIGGVIGTGHHGELGCLIGPVTAGNLIVVAFAIPAPVDNVYDNDSNNYVAQVSASASTATVGASAVLYTVLARESVGHLRIEGFQSANIGGGFICEQFSGVLSSTPVQTSSATGTVNSGTSMAASVGGFTPSSQDLVISSAATPWCAPSTGYSYPYTAFDTGGGLGFSNVDFCNSGHEGFTDGIQLAGWVSYALSATASPTTAPWSQSWSYTWDTNSANWADVLAEFTVSTFTTTSTTTTTTTTTTCTSTVTSTTTATTTKTTTTTTTVTV